MFSCFSARYKVICFREDFLDLLKIEYSDVGLAFRDAPTDTKVRRSMEYMPFSFRIKKCSLSPLREILDAQNNDGFPF